MGVTVNNTDGKGDCNDGSNSDVNININCDAEGGGVVVGTGECVPVTNCEGESLDVNITTEDGEPLEVTIAGQDENGCLPVKNCEGESLDVNITTEDGEPLEVTISNENGEPLEVTLTDAILELLKKGLQTMLFCDNGKTGLAVININVETLQPEITGYFEITSSGLSTYIPENTAEVQLGHSCESLAPEPYVMEVPACYCTPKERTGADHTVQQTYGEVPIDEDCTPFTIFISLDRSNNFAFIGTVSIGQDGQPVQVPEGSTIKYGSDCKPCAKIVSIRSYEKKYAGPDLDENCDPVVIPFIPPTPLGKIECIDCEDLELVKEIKNNQQVVSLANVPSNGNLTYQWITSNNVQIASGQNTSSIIFDITDVTEDAFVRLLITGDCGQTEFQCNFPAEFDCDQLEIQKNRNIVNVIGATSNVNLSYNWIVSDNIEIVSGDGTNQIIFSKTGTAAGTISVEITGDCETTLTCDLPSTFTPPTPLGKIECIDCEELELIVSEEEGVATLTGIPTNGNVVINWMGTSNINIISGQGTSMITWSKSDNNGGTISAQVTGDCEGIFTYNVPVTCSLNVTAQPRCVDDGSFEVLLNINANAPVTVNGVSGIVNGEYIVPTQYNSGDNYSITVTVDGFPDCTETLTGTFSCDPCDDLGCNIGISINNSKPAELSWEELTNDCGAVDYIIDWYLDYGGTEEELIVTSGNGSLFDVNTMLSHPNLGFPFPSGIITPVIRKILIDVDGDGNLETFNNINCLPSIDVLPIDCTTLPWSIDYDGPTGIAASQTVTFVKDDQNANFLHFEFDADTIIDCIQAIHNGTILYEFCAGTTGNPPISVANNYPTGGDVFGLIDISNVNVGEEIEFIVTGSQVAGINTIYSLTILECCEEFECFSLEYLASLYENASISSKCEGENDDPNVEYSIVITPPVQANNNCKPYTLYKSLQLSEIKRFDRCNLNGFVPIQLDCDPALSNTINSDGNQAIFDLNSNDYTIISNFLNNFSFPADRNKYIQFTFPEVCGDGAGSIFFTFPLFNNLGVPVWTLDSTTETLIINKEDVEFAGLTGLCEEKNGDSIPFSLPTYAGNTQNITSVFVNQFTESPGNIVGTKTRIVALEDSTGLCGDANFTVRLSFLDDDCHCQSWFVEASIDGGNTWTTILTNPNWTGSCQ